MLNINTELRMASAASCFFVDGQSLSLRNLIPDGTRERYGRIFLDTHEDAAHHEPITEQLSIAEEITIHNNDGRVDTAIAVAPSA